MTTNGSLTWTTRTSTKTIRQNGKCKCGAKFSRTIEATYKRVERSDMAHVVSSSVKYAGDVEKICGCGRRVSMLDVKGTYRADKKCDARCLNSTGHICECSCGGKNHGAGN